MFAFALLFAGSAAAQPWLEWNAPPECPGSERIGARIEEWHGQPIDEARQLDVDAAVDWTGEGWQVDVKLSLDGHVAERSIRVENCADAADFVAMTVVLAVDPDAAVPATEPQPTEPQQLAPEGAEPARPAADAESQQAGPASDERAAETPFVRPLMTAGFIVSTGALPNVAFGARLELGLSWGALETMVGGLALPQQEVAHTQAAAAVGYALYAGTLRVSYRFEFGAWSVAPGIQLGLGALEADPAEVTGVPERSTVSQLWGAVDVGVRAAWHPNGWIAPYLALAAEFPFVTPEFVLSDDTVVHQPGPGLVADAGLIIFFAGE